VHESVLECGHPRRDVVIDEQLLNRDFRGSARKGQNRTDAVEADQAPGPSTSTCPAFARLRRSMRRRIQRGASQPLWPQCVTAHYPELDGQVIEALLEEERIWLVTFLQHDLGYFDDETCRLDWNRSRIRSRRNCYPCPRNELLPMSPE